jgi:hypothetical protein
MTMIVVVIDCFVFQSTSVVESYFLRFFSVKEIRKRSTMEALKAEIARKRKLLEEKNLVVRESDES